MNHARSLWTAIGSMLRRRRIEDDMDEELREHLALEAEALVRQGVSSQEARARAAQHFGNVPLVKDACRDSLGVRVTDALVQDVRIAFRMLARHRGFTAAVLVAMALGIGANTAIFSVVYGVVLKPLPYDGGDRILVLGAEVPSQDHQVDGSFAALELADHRERTRTLANIVEYHQMWFIFYGHRQPERLRTGVVSADYFQALGIRPLHGRTFLPGDDGPHAEGVIVFSHAYWQRAFGGDPAIIGRTYRFNDRPHTVIGVLPPVPLYPEENDVFMPVWHCPFHRPPQISESRTARAKRAFARLKPGVTLEDARADLDTVTARLHASYPDAYPKDYRVRATPLLIQVTRGFTSTLVILVSTAGLVLLIVCASVVNLMLARLLRREREFAVRAAIGAGRGRLVRQLATESLVLTMAGALLGLAVAGASLSMLRALAAGFTPRAQEVTMDGTVLIFTIVLAVATGLVFGLLPALPAGRSLLPALTETGGGATGSAGRVRFRGFLVVAQVAISMVLLACAGLLMKSFVNLTRVDPGFRPEQTTTWSVPLNFTKYIQPAPRREFYTRLLERLEHEPGFSAVGASARLPLAGDFNPTARLRFRHRQVEAGRSAPQADLHVASPDYFKAIGVPLLGGRAFDARDTNEAPAVVIVNQSLASRHWGRADPIGQMIALDDSEQWFTVVGVVGNARQRLNTEPTDEVYLPLLRDPFLSTTFAARTTLSLPEAAARVRAAVAAVDPEQPVDTFRTLEDLRSEALSPPRLTAGLLGIFAGLALVVTAVGLAGVMGFSVSQRTREFGVRLALGARRSDVVALVVRQGLTLVIVGLVVGVGGGIALARRLSTLLYGVQPADPFTFAAALVVLVSVGVAACLVPARRASRVDPLLALKAE